MSIDSTGASGISLVEEDETPLNSSINTTPLVDIMLVMLIIFLITIPVVVGSIDVTLPEEQNQAVIPRPENVNLSVDTAGNVYWNMYRLPNDEELARRLRDAAVIVPQPEVHIRGDQKTEYHNVGRVVEAAQKAGIAKIGFITKNPNAGGY
ncbi:MAG: biopolymer transporter ExbD [Alphaproteobacteria bacterium]|nr:biopolymer transporter ExbD [Alphaproteobacteria bacterium]